MSSPTGDTHSAAHAERIGLINRVVPSAALDGEVERLAAQIASKSAAAIAHGKRTFNSQMGAQGDLEAAYAIAGDAMVTNATAISDAAEGIAAFVEKRPPQWTHR